jgi:8-oxo-dGTP diphosphatase
MEARAPTISTRLVVNERRVEAAGGVVVRRSGDQLEVLVVHRQRYGDWSLPKGKLEPGETHEEAALREVAEETGWRCRLVRELEAVHYTDRRGRPKTVRYWTMNPVDQVEWHPNDEVDAVRWVTEGDAGGLLTYDADRHLVAAVAVEVRGGAR